MRAFVHACVCARMRLCMFVNVHDMRDMRACPDPMILAMFRSRAPIPQYLRYPFVVDRSVSTDPLEEPRGPNLGHSKVDRAR